MNRVAIKIGMEFDKRDTTSDEISLLFKTTNIIIQCIREKERESVYCSEEFNGEKFTDC